MSDIYLLRHGETEWNAIGRYQGRFDSPLTARGRDQADALGRRLAGIFMGLEPPAIHVSPLGRARETAYIISRHLPNFTQILVEPRLREVSQGSWDGLTRSEAETGWPELFNSESPEDWYVRAPDGEGFDTATARLQDWMDHLEEPVIALSHAFCGRLIRNLWLGLGSETWHHPVSQDTVWHLSDGRVTMLS